LFQGKRTGCLSTRKKARGLCLQHAQVQGNVPDSSPERTWNRPRHARSSSTHQAERNLRSDCDDQAPVSYPDICFTLTTFGRLPEGACNACERTVLLHTQVRLLKYGLHAAQTANHSKKLEIVLRYNKIWVVVSNFGYSIENLGRWKLSGLNGLRSCGTCGYGAQ
jgi:hypothetical protein